MANSDSMTGLFQFAGSGYIALKGGVSLYLGEGARHLAYHVADDGFYIAVAKTAAEAGTDVEWTNSGTYVVAKTANDWIEGLSLVEAQQILAEAGVDTPDTVLHGFFMEATRHGGIKALRILPRHA